MLIRLSIENYSSFKDEVVLNLAPVKSRVMKDHIIKSEKGKKIYILPVACIYGANASGKTNFVKAIEFAQEFIVDGTKPNAVTGVKSNLLASIDNQHPSRFEFIFKHQDVVYTFGFVVDEKIVYEEWLFAYYTNQESRLYERITENGKAILKSGERLTAGNKPGFIDFIAQGTRPNQLFLTEAIQKNVDILKPVMDWFENGLVVIKPESKYLGLTAHVIDNKSFENFLCGILRVADVGIDGIDIEEELFDIDKHLKGIEKKDREDILRKMSSAEFSRLYIQGPDRTSIIQKKGEDGKLFFNKLRTKHKKSDGSVVPFDTDYESDGTKRLMDLAPMLFNFWNKERVYVIDELDRSLHTMIARLFLEMCVHNKEGKERKSQYIITTHDTNLLDRNLLRKDEIWFMEKDCDGLSHLTSLADYKISQGLNYENGYLNGRFGAIPLIGDWEKLFK